MSRELLNTAEGARLLSYVEAVKVGEDRSVEKEVHSLYLYLMSMYFLSTFDIHMYRCYFHSMCLRDKVRLILLM